MIEPKDLLYLVINPVNVALGLQGSEIGITKADLLILGTACAESDCGRYLIQRGGPALGICGMEPGMTGHDDIWVNYLASRSELTRRVKLLMTNPENPTAEEMTWNLKYSCAMARIKYLRDKDKIPDTLPGQAAYWKRVYNTEAGKGTLDRYIAKWNQFIGQGGFAGTV